MQNNNTFMQIDEKLGLKIRNNRCWIRIRSGLSIFWSAGTSTFNQDVILSSKSDWTQRYHQK